MFAYQNSYPPLLFTNIPISQLSLTAILLLYELLSLSFHHLMTPTCVPDRCHSHIGTPIHYHYNVSHPFQPHFYSESASFSYRNPSRSLLFQLINHTFYIIASYPYWNPFLALPFTTWPTTPFSLVGIASSWHPFSTHSSFPTFQAYFCPW